MIIIFFRDNRFSWGYGSILNAETDRTYLERGQSGYNSFISMALYQTPYTSSELTKP